MPLTVPTTVSPGKLRVHYLGAGGMKHTASVRYVDGSFPADIVAAQGQANDFADALAAVIIGDDFSAYAWSLLNNEGVQVARGQFTPPIAGVAGPGDGIPGSVSPTLTFLGSGIAPDFDTAFGRISMRLYVGASYAIPPAVDRILIDGVTGLETMLAFLTSGPYWADVWGQGGVVEPYVAVQYNAGVQRKRGA